MSDRSSSSASRDRSELGEVDRAIIKTTPGNLTMIQIAPDLQKILSDRLHTNQAAIADLCQRWHIAEFALFGSVLRDDFRSDSDIDILITFSVHHPWNLFDFMNLQRELETLFEREVDLIQKKELQNPFRRANILQTHQIVDASEQICL